MTYATLCSGIGAPECAWEPMGWTCAFQAEIEAFPSAVLKHHFPNTPNYGDITKFKSWPDHDELDLLCGGTPCQSFSVAGLRGGLDDPRGNLCLTFLAVVARYAPRWIVWENVPGVLSDDGNAFGCFLSGLGQLGYGFAYRILDAQHWGVPQRRRRVFVVGHSGGAWQRAAAVLFERACLCGHPPTRQGPRQNVAPSLAARTRGGGGLGTDAKCDGALIASCINTGSHGGITGQDATQPGRLIAYGGNNTSGPINTATACNAHGGTGRSDFESETFITHSLRGEGHDASEDGTGMGTPLTVTCFQSSQSGVREVETHATLDANNGSRRHNGVAGQFGIRRLLPVETEKLQGFPPGWTDIEFKGKRASDSARYKVVGNSMAVPVLSWIGQRIAMLEGLVP